MSRAWKRPLGSMALAGFVVFLGFAAAGCGSSGGDGGSSATEIPGLGSSLDEIKQKARDEGEVDIVQWAGYAQLVDEFKQETGCTVKTKDGPTSDDMISLITSGQYDGVSASGNASVRLMARGDVAPIDTDLIPNYADVQEGLKNQPYNSRDDQPYGVPHGRGPNLLTWRTDDVTPAPDSWSVIWDKNTPYKGKISIYDDSIFIADAALYLKATQPDLGIDDPYQLDEEQFDAAVNLLKGLAPNVGEWWADYAKQIQSFCEPGRRRRHGLAVPGEHPQGRQEARRGDQAEGGHHRLVGHLDDLLEGEASELHVPLDEPHDLAGGAGVGRRGLRRGPDKPEGMRSDEEQEPLRRVPRSRRVVVGRRLLLDHSNRRLRRRGRDL